MPSRDDAPSLIEAPERNASKSLVNDTETVAGTITMSNPLRRKSRTYRRRAPTLRPARLRKSLFSYNKTLSRYRFPRMTSKLTGLVRSAMDAEGYFSRSIRRRGTTQSMSPSWLCCRMIRIDRGGGTAPAGSGTAVRAANGRRMPITVRFRIHSAERHTRGLNSSDLKAVWEESDPQNRHPARRRSPLRVVVAAKVHAVVAEARRGLSANAESARTDTRKGTTTHT